MEKKSQSEIDAAAIQEAEKKVKEMREQSEAEDRRVQAFGSKEELYSFRRKEKEALNALERLKSKKREAVMQEICDQEILPRLKALRETPMDEKKRIETMLELASHSEAIYRVMTHFQIFEDASEVQFELSDEGLRNIFGEKTESVSTSLKRIRDDIREVRDERLILKPGQAVIISLVYGRAKELEAKGMGKIVQNTEPIWIERIREDREPVVMESLRTMTLGSPIVIDGELSEPARSLQKKAYGKLEISPTGFAQFVDDRQVKKILKKFE